MIFRIEEFRRDVRVAIDMNRGDTSLLGDLDVETLGLDEVIDSKIEEGARLAVLEASPILLENGHDIIGVNDDRHFYIREDGRGWILLPADFLRLVCFRMTDWERPVTEAIEESDPRYALQHSRWAGIRGNPERPVVAVVRRGDGLRLEFYSSSNGNAKVAEGSYVPQPRIDECGGIDIPERCYMGAVYRAGALTLASLGDEMAGTLLELSRGALS